MSILSKIQSGKVGRAQKLVIYAPEGFGKSTLASQFPDPLFLDFEGSTSQLDVARLDRQSMPDIRAVEQAIAEIAKAKPCKTVVGDTVDWLDDMAAADLIREANSEKIKSIEDFGYGKGYVALKERMVAMLAKFDSLIAAGINVVLLAHSKVAKFEPPDGQGAFDRYTLKLSKHVEPLVKEWADAVIFGNWRTQIKESDSGKLKGIGGKERMLYANRCAAWDAKNRHNLGDSEPWHIDTIKKAFTNVGAPWGESKSSVVGNPQPVVTVKAQPVADTTTPEQIPIDPDVDKQLAEGDFNPVVVAAVKAAGEDKVTAYLRHRKTIGETQTWLDMPESYAVKIATNPAGFKNAMETFQP